MSQKSILSFFKSAEPTSAKETKRKCIVVQDNAVKKSKNKRKVKCIESDEESPDVPSKKFNGNCSKEPEDSPKKTGESSDESFEEKTNGEIKENGDLSSEKPSEQKKIEKEEETNSSHSPTKVETNSSNTENVSADTPAEATETPTDSNENVCEELIPKRKTARKQMSSAKNTKKNSVKPIKDESESKAMDKEVTSKNVPKSKEAVEHESMDFETEVTNDKSSEKPENAEKHVKTEKSLKDVQKSDVRRKISATSEEENSPLKKSAKKDSIHSFFTSVKADEDKNSTKDDDKKSAHVDTDDSPVKKVQKKKTRCLESDDEDNESTSVELSIKKEEEEDTKKMNSDQSPQKNEDAVKSITPEAKPSQKEMSSAKDTKRNSVKPIKDESESETMDKHKEVTSKNVPKSNEAVEHESMDCETEVTQDESSEKQENTEKHIKKEKTLKDVKKSDVKRKIIATSKEENSPLKKPAKKDSIHSFFTSVKNEDKNSTKENDKKSVHIETDDTDDSPVKKVQKNKTQCLESDDEDNKSTSVESSVKKEPEDTEKMNSDQSPQKNEDTVKSPRKSDDAVKSEAPEVKPSPSQKPSSGSLKNDKEKQKFGVKSTSAVDTVYNPSKNHYHPIDDAFWKQNEKVPYLALAKTLELIENTSGRLKTIEILSNFFRSVMVLSPDDFLHSVYLCLNRVAPEYEGIEMGVGETLLMKAVAQATGRTVEKIKAEVAIKGDLGLVSESSRGNQRVMFAPPKLTVSTVFNRFLDIAKMSGNAAMSKKTDKIKSLFVACRDCEAKYIIRSLGGKLRIGLAEQSVLSAIARAAVITPPGQKYPPKNIDASQGMSSDNFKKLLDSQTLILKTAYCECPNYDLIIPVLLKEGISALPERCQLSPGVPLKPMLAHPTVGIDKVLERFEKNAFTCEFKYDGERAQIHMNDKGEVKIFSRNQEDNTSKYPDIISRLSNVVKESTKSFILDSEAVAWDRKTKQILPFQVLSTRKRKDAVESEIVVQVCVMAFDLLFLNGESLVKKPLKERRSLLHSSFNEVENQFMFAQYRDGDSAETMQEFLDESMKGNCEGLMIKSLEVDASYEIAKRSHNWLKLKKDYLNGVGDTLDLVVIGGYYGKGKRVSNYGGFLLACYDEENEEYQSICKLGTGLKDDDLAAHTKFLKEKVIEQPKSYYRYDHSLEPDVWFEAVQVWEIKCADLSISPVHKAAIGIVDPQKGISLRFPRFVRIRDDKSPENATNSTQVADMYRQQQQIQNTSKNSKVEEDFY